MGGVGSRLAGYLDPATAGQQLHRGGSGADDLSQPVRRKTAVVRFVTFCVVQGGGRGVKRRREVEEDLATSCEIERLLNTPKKKKLFTTSQYIYENLFQVKTCLELS